MFYELELKSYIRVPPILFSEDTDKALLKQLNTQFESFISKDLGIAIGVLDIIKIGDGIIIPGDGAAYYDTTFKLLTFKPELNEMVLGEISEITDFGAFINIGPIDGMIHISQTMDDYVSFSKSNVLTGKETKKNLKAKDQCRARIIAISYKKINEPKIGLTMRQPSLGKLDEIEKELKEVKKKTEKKIKNT
ncbi:MAG: DNA-directed RNA polymerase [Nanoarchaeota archaeon]|nr:DNA-directed RNA polymerase [Nanoarchaeota archaeon]